MNRMIKISTGTIGLVASMFVMVGFQNCGKITVADASGSASPAKLAAGKAPTPDTLIIDIKSPTSPLSHTDSSAHVAASTPKSDATPEMHSQAETPSADKAPEMPRTIVIDPSTAGFVSHPVDQVVNLPAVEGKKHCKVDGNEKDGDKNDTEMNHHAKKHHQKHAKKHYHEAKEKMHEDCDEDHDEVEFAANCEDQQPVALKKKIAHCGDFEIEDILLNIKSASSNDHDADESDSDFEITDSDKTISLNKAKLKLKARHNGHLKKLFLGLNNKGNKVLNKDLQVVDLKTAFSKGAGLTVKLDGDTTIKEGHEYSLEMTIEQDEQVVENPAKCLFKPVIKVAILSED